MSTPTKIVDARTGNSATITSLGQMIVAPLDYSSPTQAKLVDINTAYNMISPVQDKAIIITDIILTANKSVGAGDATVSIYAGNSDDTLISIDDILNLEMLKNTSLPLIGLNTKIDQGLFVNAKTDDNDIYVTLMFYRVNA